MNWKYHVVGMAALFTTVTVQAAPVAIDTLTVDTLALTVTVDGDSTVYNWGGILPTPVLIQMGVYQDPILEWGTAGTIPYAKVYATAADGAPAPNGTVDFDAGTIAVDFTSVYADADVGSFNLTLGPIGNLTGTSTPPDGYTLDWNSTWEVALGGGGGHHMTGMMSGNWSCRSGCTETGTVTLEFGGTVSTVPVPAAVWLFGSGMIGLAGLARRRKAA